MIDTQEAVDYLNSILELDSVALTALFSVRVACSKEMYEKTCVECKKQASGGGQTPYSVTVLDLLRGIFKDSGIGYTLSPDKKICFFSLDKGPGV
jgi:hypothetical protein